MNIFSSILIFLSILVLLFKGLNLGVDFKGGTLIEVRTENSKSDIAEIRQSLLRMNLGDVTVKKFGKEQDYLVKIEMTKTNDMDFIQSINEQLSSDLGSVVNFRRVENVGPKVSNELLKAGLLALSLYRNNLSHLPKSIGNLINLEHLDLGQNQLASIPESIGSLINLHEFSYRFSPSYHKLSSCHPVV